MSTVPYFKELFPLADVQRVFDTDGGVGKVRVQASSSKRPNVERWQNEEGVASFHYNFVISRATGVDPETTEPVSLDKTALHAASDTARLFALDLDLDLFGDAYKSCCQNNHPTAPYCRECWWQLVFAGRVYCAALKNIFAWHAALRNSDRMPLWKDPLWCFSGRRGLHLYCHPCTDMQVMPAQARKIIVTALVTNWMGWCGPALLAEAEHQSERPVWLFDANPIDFNASTMREGKTMRMPFSPHLSSEFACTPFSVQTFGSSLPEEYAIKWNFEKEGLEKSRAAMQRALAVFKEWVPEQNGLEGCDIACTL